LEFETSIDSVYSHALPRHQQNIYYYCISKLLAKPTKLNQHQKISQKKSEPKFALTINLIILNNQFLLNPILFGNHQCFLYRYSVSAVVSCYKWTRKIIRTKCFSFISCVFIYVVLSSCVFHPTFVVF